MDTKKVKVEITNLKMNSEVFYIRDPDPGLPPGVDENKDCKIVLEGAQSVILKVDESDIPALKQRIAKIEGLRLDRK